MKIWITGYEPDSGVWFCFMAGRHLLTCLNIYVYLFFFPQVCHFYLKAIMWNIRGIFTMCFICFAQNMAKMSWWVACLKTTDKSGWLNCGWHSMWRIFRHQNRMKTYWKSVIITWYEIWKDKQNFKSSLN